MNNVKTLIDTNIIYANDFSNNSGVFQECRNFVK